MCLMYILVSSLISVHVGGCGCMTMLDCLPFFWMQYCICVCWIDMSVLVPCLMLMSPTWKCGLPAADLVLELLRSSSTYLRPDIYHPGLQAPVSLLFLLFCCSLSVARGKQCLCEKHADMCSSLMHVLACPEAAEYTVLSKYFSEPVMYEDNRQCLHLCHDAAW